MLVAERLLHWMKLRLDGDGGGGRLCEPLDGRQREPLCLDSQHETRADRLAIGQDGAGAAHAVLAAHVRAREVQLVAQEIRQRHAGLGPSLPRTTVHRQADSVLHAAGPVRSAAAESVRSASTAATRRRYSAVACRSPSGESAAAAARAASRTRSGAGCSPVSIASAAGPLTAVPPTPKKARRDPATRPSPPRQRTAAAPTS